MVTQKQVMAALKECFDPEIPISIVDMGLIYGVDIKKGRVIVRMTLTSPACPMSDVLAADIKQKVIAVKGVLAVDVEFTFEPPWSPERMSLEGRDQLGM